MTTVSPSTDDVRAWFAQRLPAEWTQQEPEISVEDKHVTVNVRLESADTEDDGDDDGDETVTGGKRKKGGGKRIGAWRKESAETRAAISADAASQLGVRVTWAATLADKTRSFTGKTVGVKTKLRRPQVETLDAIVASGAAKSRAHALRVALRVAESHQDEWQTQ